MRIHKTLKVPDVGESIPYALSPSTKTHPFVVYALDAARMNRPLVWLIAVPVVPLWVVGIVHFGSRVFRGSANAQGIWDVLVFIMFVGLPLCLIGSWIYRVSIKGTKNDLIVNTETGDSQIQLGHNGGTDVAPGFIAIHTAQLVDAIEQGKSSSIIPWVLFFWRKRHVAHLVVVHIQIDAAILGVFKSQESAALYARDVHEITTLPIVEHPDVRFDRVAGNYAYFFSDRRALRKRKKTRPRTSVAFR